MGVLLIPLIILLSVYFGISRSIIKYGGNATSTPLLNMVKYALLMAVLFSVAAAVVLTILAKIGIGSSIAILLLAGFIVVPMLKRMAKDKDTTLPL